MDSTGEPSSPVSSRRYGIQVAASNFIHAPLTALLEYSGVLQTRSNFHERESLISSDLPSPPAPRGSEITRHDLSSDAGGEEVSIRIIGPSEHDNVRETPIHDLQSPAERVDEAAVTGEVGRTSESGSSSDRSDSGGDGGDAESGSGVGGGNRASSYQRYDIQHIARWIEQIIPFSLLLLLVFVRQHLQGFFVTIWISAVLLKSNDILRKQTALKVERKISSLLGLIAFSVFHVMSIYWWYQNDDVVYPLFLLPPTTIPPFWHAIFIIMVNDTLVRQAAMVLKCLLLMYYKNSRGCGYRKQGQMLTLIEYLLLLYRALLPAPVWYRYFLNKEYGSLFSSLITGLYLTFKLTSVVEKVQLFLASLKALSRKDVHFGSHATSEQVNAAGDLCAICQEKMHAPILLRCKHIFCEDCVSEWFERERTCPLCRAVVKPADIRSYSDGSTSLFFQLF